MHLNYDENLSFSILAQIWDKTKQIIRPEIIPSFTNSVKMTKVHIYLKNLCKRFPIKPETTFLKTKLKLIHYT